MHAFAYLYERFPSLTQTFCYREIRELNRQGIQPALFSIRRPEEIPVDCPAAIRQAVEYLPDPAMLSLKEKSRWRYWLPGQRRVRLALQETTTDIQRLYTAIWLGPRLQARGIGHVHVHFAGIAARTAYWLKKLYGITFSFTAHANDVFCETSFPIGLNDLFREASLIVTVSDFSRAWLQERFPFAADKIERVYNGIDTALFNSQRSSASSVPMILSVGRCIEKKGYPDLIDACALLKSRGVAFRCRIVGGGPLEESLRSQVNALDLASCVELTGSQPQEKVHEALAEADLFVLACAREKDGGMDNLPTVIAEAMAAGLPVVSTHLAGVPEMVLEGSTGHLVPERNPTALADAMQALLADRARALEMGRAGRALVESRFDAEVTARDLKQLFENRLGLRLR
jgi:glycosyltransferase involved in cell wall biosynthesis